MGPNESLTPSGQAAHTVFLCPVTRIGTLKQMQFDLVINSRSLSEMSDDYVEFYRNWLATRPTRYFYSFDRLLTGSTFHAEGSNLFAPRLPPDWRILWSSCRPVAAVKYCHLLAYPAPASARMDVWRGRLFPLPRPLAPGTMCHLLHVADSSSDARLIHKLLRAIAEEIDSLPVEALFMARRIDALERAKPRLSASEKNWVATIARNVEGNLSAGTSCRVPSHLWSRQQKLYHAGQAPRSNHISVTHTRQEQN
jgi:hypothetical protein